VSFLIGCTVSPSDQSSLPSLVGSGSSPKWCVPMARATAPCNRLISASSSASLSASSIVFTPSDCLFACSAALKYFDAASVQSAFGSSTPPPLIEKSSMSVGIITTVAPFGRLLKPGARFFDCAHAGWATKETANSRTAATRMR